MSEVISLYEVQLELTDGSAEVVYRKHNVVVHPKSYKARVSGKMRMWKKDTEGKTAVIVAVPNKIIVRTWTLQELYIPEMHELLHLAAVRIIADMQVKLQRMYDRNKVISRDTPVKERKWLE